MRPIDPREWTPDQAVQWAREMLVAHELPVDESKMDLVRYGLDLDPLTIPHFVTSLRRNLEAQA